MLTRRSFVAAAGLSAFSNVRLANAQDAYPSRLIRLIVGYPAGGGVDIVARLLADPMKRSYAAITRCCAAERCSWACRL